MERIYYFIEQDLRQGFTIVFTCLVLIVVAALIDLWAGIDAARANKERVRSRPLRRTGQKILDYYKLQFVFLLVDVLGLVFPWYTIPYASVLCTACVLLIEGMSVVENLRKKKSSAASVAQVAEKIVACLTSEEAEDIIRIIKESRKDSEK